MKTSSLLISTALTLSAIFNPAQAADDKPLIIDKHVILVLDRSSSMDSTEQRVMMQGVNDAINSELAAMTLSSGQRYAFSFVYYAFDAKHSDTYFVDTQEAAKNMSAELIWDEATDSAKALPNLRDGTMLYSGLGKVKELIEREGDLGYESMSRSIVVFSDDPSSGKHVDIRELSLSISEELGATIHGVALTQQGENAAVSQFFKKSVITPAGTSYNHPKGFSVALQPGFFQPAYKPEQVTTTVTTAMNLANF